MILPRRGPVLFRWFFSYLAILLIPLVFSVAVYFYSLDIINESSGEIYQSSLEQFRIEMDNFTGNAIQSLQQLSMNSNVQVLTFVKDNPEPRHRWNIIQTINEIRKIQIILPLVEEIFVVLNPLNTVITTSTYMPLDIFYNTQFKNNFADNAEFISFMKEPHRNNAVLIDNRLLFLQTSTEGLLSDSSATLGLSFRKDILTSRFFNTYESTGGRIFILQNNNQIVYGSKENDKLPFYSGDSESGFKGIIDGARYNVLTLDSQLMDWTYLYFIPENLEKIRARRIQLFTFVGLLTCSILGLLLSYIITKRNYSPVKKLMSVYGNSNEQNRGEDEFRWMERKALDTQTALGNNFLALRKYIIQTILEKPFDPDHGKSKMDRYNIKLDGEWNLVLIFTAGSAVPSMVSDNMQHVIAGIFTEIAGNSFIGESCELGDYLCFIVNWSGEPESFITRLEEIIEYTQQETEKSLHIRVVTALGEPRAGLNGIYFSNLEARETLEYFDSNSEQNILHYRDIKYSGNKYRYSQETEQKLINLIKTGNREASIDLLRQIWNENVNSQNPQRRITRLLFYNLLGTLTKSMEQDIALEELFPHELNIENTLPQELIIILEKTVKEICDSNSLLRHEKHENQLSLKIKKYIEENYKNPDINISITSLYFNMNPAYLAGIFKEETGSGLLEYINNLRIEESKRLLKTGMEVNEAAEESGFRGAGTFIRVFKKQTGITPGQFREI